MKLFIEILKQWIPLGSHGTEDSVIGRVPPPCSRLVWAVASVAPLAIVMPAVLFCRGYSEGGPITALRCPAPTAERDALLTSVLFTMVLAVLLSPGTPPGLSIPAPLGLL